ncbi:MAG: hypothetical protein VYC95_02475 [Verrucomicrobiota bacterium]|nr:hypothetical protein [Verrucomicrobiota bacterium]
MERRSKCRRTVEDEEAGLLFCWRIGRGSVRRTMMAIVLAAVLCIVGALLVRVEGSQENRGRREATRITVLTPGSEASRRWLAWARQEAPFLDRWEPTGDGTLQVRMERLEANLLAETRHETLLHPSAERPVGSDLPPILDPIRPGLPQLKKNMARLKAAIEVEGHLIAEVDEGLRERWGDPPPASPVRDLLAEGQDQPERLQPRELLGLDRRFRVSVNERGMIETCQVLDPEEREVDDLIARWLRGQRLKPGQDALVWGEVRVRVRGVPGGEAKAHSD